MSYSLGDKSVINYGGKEQKTPGETVREIQREREREREREGLCRQRERTA